LDSLRDAPLAVVRDLVNASLLAEKASEYRGSLLKFVQAAWPILQPSTEFRITWHVEAICNHLEAVTPGRHRRPAISVPPRHLKSSLVSVLWLPWVWLSNPGWRQICASYADALARRDSVSARRVLKSSWYCNLVADKWHLLDDRDTQSEFSNSKGGRRL